MIQAYRAENTDYTHNGDMTLTPSSAVLTAAINDTWTVQLEHPIDNMGRWKYVSNGAVIKLPSFNGEQLFRVKETEKTDSGVTAILEPIFMDAMDDCFLLDVSPSWKNGQEALDMMTTANPKYRAKSNIMTVTSSSYQYQNLIEAINGSGEESFVNRWGGEIEFDNYTINVNYRIGRDNGVELRYGKNIPEDGVRESVDMRDVVTRIYPQAYNGYAMSENGCVDSPLIGSYPTVKTRTMTFDDVKMRADAQSSDAEKDVTICDTQEELDAALKERCDAQYSAGIDKPKVTIEADMAQLEYTEQYREYAELEKVSLGDTVHCVHSRLGITTQERVIELTYDCISQKVTGVVLGEKSPNYFDKVSGTISRVDSAIRSDGTVIADQVTGRLNASLAQLVGQYDIAEKQDVLAILFENLDETSEMFGALAIGTQGILISKQRTADGKEWVWTTAISYAGIMADVIVSGRMQTKDGRFYIDLDKGEGTLTSILSPFEMLDYDIGSGITTVPAEMNLYFKNPPVDILNGDQLYGLALDMNGKSFISICPPILSGSKGGVNITFLRKSGKNGWIQLDDTIIIQIGEGYTLTLSNDRAWLNGDLEVNGNLKVNGKIDAINDKTRSAKNIQRKIGESFYEMSEPYFGDIGEGKTDENGQAR